MQISTFLQGRQHLGGLLAGNPRTNPLEIDWLTSTSGKGMAAEMAVAFAVNHWDFGFGVGGIANRIEWREYAQRHLTRERLIGGDGFIYVKRPLPGVTVRKELPVTYAGDVAYHADKWSVLWEFSHGFNDNTFRAGFEYRLGGVELRGAGRYSNGWYPTAGVGFNLTRTWGLDVAAYGSQTFLEDSRHLGLAFSFRLDKDRE